MSDNFTDGNDDMEEESFAELFASYNARMGDDLQVGDKIQGEIVSIGMDTVFINTGTKVDGAVNRVELLDENGDLPYQKGDMLELYVVSFDENEMLLSRALSGAGNLRVLKDAFTSKIPVQGKVRAECKGGFHVDIMQRRSFCPVSQIDTRYVEKPELYVGQTMDFLITRYEENGRNIVVSRRELLVKEQAKARKEFLDAIKPDTIIEGRVATLMPYGIFVELIPGVEGMVHVSEMSWGRVEKPGDLVREDDLVRIKIIGITEGKKPGEVKISLSMKQAEGDPWESGKYNFQRGDKVQGKVTRLADFGAFVAIAPGIEGLVHISEMSYTKRIARPQDVVSEGDMIEVMVKDIDPAKRRISLSIREIGGDPWSGMGSRYTVGQSVTGKLEKKEKFGWFIELEPGITGLLPLSKMRDSRKKAEFEKLVPGDSITVMVAQIQPEERKITLAPPDGETTESADDWRQYAKGNKQDQSVGSLGDMLRKAMKDNK